MDSKLTDKYGNPSSNFCQNKNLEKTEDLLPNLGIFNRNFDLTS